MSRKDVVTNTQVLYRFYNADKKLLYVGISQNWMARLSQHYKHAEWFDQAVYAYFEHFNTRKEVEQAEKKALATEGAIHNIAFNPDHEGPVNHFRKIRGFVYGDKSSDTTHRDLVHHLKKLQTEDDFWRKKTSSHLAYWLLKALPELNPQCPYCPDVFHSNQIRAWANESKSRRMNAANSRTPQL
jgi:predicted GIY-YIG superfamily endonuclease